MKRALVIRHVPFEGVAGFRAPIEAAGYAIDRIDVTDPAFPTLDLVSPDLVVMMGGPMGVYEQEAYPWLSCEIGRLAKRIAADRPTLGVCLGSQIIAAAMGANVYPGPVKEVGFSTIEINETGLGSPLRNLVDVPVLHWHGDTFDLPEGAELLASSAAYPHQVFRRGRTILALQCHAEMGEDPRYEQWLQDVDYLRAADTDPEKMRVAHSEHGVRAVTSGRKMIAEWLEAI